jgi:hypothetical protein
LQQPDKTQKANVLTGAAGFVYILNWDIQRESKPVQKQLFVSLVMTNKSIRLPPKERTDGYYAFAL